MPRPIDCSPRAVFLLLKCCNREILWSDANVYRRNLFKMAALSLPSWLRSGLGLRLWKSSSSPVVTDGLGHLLHLFVFGPPNFCSSTFCLPIPVFTYWFPPSSWFGLYDLGSSFCTVYCTSRLPRRSHFKKDQWVHIITLWWVNPCKHLLFPPAPVGLVFEWRTKPALDFHGALVPQKHRENRICD